MSDNPMLKIKQVHCSLHGFMYGYCTECMRTGECGSVYEVPLPPAPRISEEEIQRVVNELCEASDDYWREKFAAILRTLNEERKA